MAEKTRIVVVGGVAGGASAAARARRLSEDAEITMIERGEYVSFANCGLPYHIGGAIADRKKLSVQTPESLHAMFNMNVRVSTEVVSIDREKKQVVARDLKTGTEETVPYHKLILSPGAEPVVPPIPGVDHPLVKTLRSMGDMDAIKKIVDEDKPAQAVIVGGGYIGLEMAEALREREIGVTIAELTPQVMGPMDPEMASFVHENLRLHGVNLLLETSVTGFEPVKGGIRANLSSGEYIDCGLVVMSVGVKPENSLAKATGLEIGKRGGIVVDEYMRTSDPDIFAVGDAVEVTDFVIGNEILVPLAGPANRQGRIAADNAFGRKSSYKKTQGTGIVKIFDLTAGMTGANEKCLKLNEVPYEKIYVHPTNHASYYPGATPVSLKLLFDPKNGKILGAQAVGIDGVDKRIDVLATAIRAGMTVFDLEELELAYAPPYGSAKDIVNFAGFVAANAVRGDVKLCHVEDFLNPRHDQMILDVRKPMELHAGAIPGAVNIPIQELRARIEEVPKDKELLVYCQVGQRGYYACRMLTQLGYNCRNLTGGYKTYSAATRTICSVPQQPTKEGDVDDTGMSLAARGTDDDKKSEDHPRSVSTIRLVDACGLQCPGPIMAVAQEMEKIREGEAITVVATDPGFPSDIGPWCESTGNRLIEVVPENGQFKATVAKGSGIRAHTQEMSKKKTIVVFSGDFDKAVAAFVIANGAAAMGSEVTMFFTFWGLNVLRKPEGAAVKKNVIEKMFGWMMPRGADKLQLSKMNMGGMGLAMIKGIMKKKNVASLPEFIQSAKSAGVDLVACTMSMDLMGIKQEELIDGVIPGGVAMYLNRAEEGNVNLFV